MVSTFPQVGQPKVLSWATQLGESGNSAKRVGQLTETGWATCRLGINAKNTIFQSPTHAAECKSPSFPSASISPFPLGMEIPLLPTQNRRNMPHGQA
ncbi:hypothetical protein DXB34_15795 [Phocaeicola vulgatus]|nr:hypothetical protein DXB34_15795 [Phocaeicola vulgatus]